MNKQQLVEAIKDLPKFDKRDVFLKDGEELVKQKQDGICEVGKYDSLSYVSKEYSLVQFSDIFHPIVESINVDVEGYLASRGGFAIMTVFPEMDSLKNEDGNFGLMAMNSVDRSCSIIVKFVVKQGELSFTIPPKVAGLKKQHTGDSKNILKDYISMIGKVQDAWKHIITEFPKQKIVMENVNDPNALEFNQVLKDLKLGTRLSKALKERFDIIIADKKEYTLWDLFIDAVQTVSTKKHKSDVAREKKIDALCQAIFDYSFLLGI